MISSNVRTTTHTAPRIASPLWSRRRWLGESSRAVALASLVPRSRDEIATYIARAETGYPHQDVGDPRRTALPIAPGIMQDLAVRAVEATKAAGAAYADARLTRLIQHAYGCQGVGTFDRDVEVVGIGIRAFVDGYWGFAASPFWTVDEIAQLATNAVLQARENAKGPARPVELGSVSAVTGTWATPVKIDPFTVSIEEKRDYITYWKRYAEQHHVPFYYDGYQSTLFFVRQERVTATSAGSLVTQTTYETSGKITCGLGATGGITPVGTQDVAHIDVAAKGWELFLEADLPKQFEEMEDGMRRPPSKPPTHIATVGRYTIVCDGKTMASMLEQTLGLATQLDRALGYEANASGTTFLDDPLALVGSFPIASPLVTVTANRSAPTQLATVKWDDECVTPAEVTLVKEGILTDFQTTREQAAWLAPYYQKHGRPIQSNGYAAAENALRITMQHMPNLAMTPSPSPIELQDLVANVQDGILIENGGAESDFQVEGGTLSGSMRQIRNGRLGPSLIHGAIQFDTLDFWKNVVAVGGATTQGGVDQTQYSPFGRLEKGEPSQATSHSVRAVAATIKDQTLIDPARKA